MTLHIRPATEGDLAQIADVAVAAFHPDTDAISRRLFPPHLQPTATDADADADGQGPARRWRLVRKGMKLRADNTALMVVVDDALNGKVVGFSMWDTPAGGDEMRSAVSSPAPSAALDEAAFEEMHHALDKDVQKHFGAGGIKDVFHLDYIAVDPQQQRRGIGKMLLDWGMTKAAEQRRSIYLVATPAGRPLYQAAGFEDLGPLQIFDVPHYSMIRRFE
ncbi:GNAT family acetyltransferase [Purpureocillium lavendulum]|uniref:GNAT family acetyltransferase n=1 Tax=Purpureocillium lavendulum TaxID=1247861 RepID=A0AB34FQ00_9HYPO|nr:GNAT family acetyltransferase [Purpureocillium lavendulum]